MLNLLGEKIRHKTLGIGEVIYVEENYITIKFPSKTARFAYPSAFEKYLSPEENKIADVTGIMNYILASLLLGNKYHIRAQNSN